MNEVDRAKRRAGRRAADYIVDGMRVGLGTGSTVYHTIAALGERRPDIVCAASSERSRALAQDLGLTVVAPDEVRELDIAVDGADEVDPQLNLVKGGGGAHTREKIVAEMAARFLVVVDESKLVAQLGAFGLPLAVLDFAPGVVATRVRALGASALTTRSERSDDGNLLLDAQFGLIADPAALAARLEAIPGVVEHGLFLGGTVERVIVAGGDGSIRELVHAGRDGAGATPRARPDRRDRAEPAPS